jgi:hypothetical protein
METAARTILFILERRVRPESVEETDLMERTVRRRAMTWKDTIGPYQPFTATKISEGTV